MHVSDARRLPFSLSEPFSSSVASALGTAATWFLCVSAPAHLYQVSSFATSIARLVFVPTLTSLVSLAFAALALLDLSLQCQCPSVVVTVGGRLWRDIFRLESECLASPSVLSTSGGSQALAGDVVPFR